MAILQAVADQVELACIVVDKKLADIDRAVNLARRTADRVRRAARSRFFKNNPIIPF